MQINCLLWKNIHFPIIWFIVGNSWKYRSTFLVWKSHFSCLDCVHEDIRCLLKTYDRLDTIGAFYQLCIVNPSNSIKKEILLHWFYRWVVRFRKINKNVQAGTLAEQGDLVSNYFWFYFFSVYFIFLCSNVQVFALRPRANESLHIEIASVNWFYFM